MLVWSALRAESAQAATGHVLQCFARATNSVPRFLRPVDDPVGLHPALAVYARRNRPRRSIRSLSERQPYLVVYPLSRPPSGT